MNALDMLCEYIGMKYETVVFDRRAEKIDLKHFDIHCNHLTYRHRSVFALVPPGGDVEAEVQRAIDTYEKDFVGRNVWDARDLAKHRDMVLRQYGEEGYQNMKKRVRERALSAKAKFEDELRSIDACD